MIKKIIFFIFISTFILIVNSYYLQANETINSSGGSSLDTIKAKKSVKRGKFAGNYYMRSQLTLTDAVNESNPWNVTGSKISKFGSNSFNILYLHVEFTNTYSDFTATLKLKDGEGNLKHEDSMYVEGGYGWWRFNIGVYSPLGNLNGQEIRGELYVDNQYVNSISAYRTENPYRNLTVQANTSYKEQNNFTSNAKFSYLESAAELKAVLMQNGQVKKESSITTVELQPFYHYKEYNWYPSINNLPPGNFTVEFKAKFLARNWETMTSKNIVVAACTNVYYLDNDRDGYGNPSIKKQACTNPPGYVTNNRDCNDSNANIKPGATEQCNGIDDNCNNQIDEGVKNACEKCGPVPTEICDGIDNDCDGSTDEGVQNTYYFDSDKDGFGNPNNKTQACSKPSGYVTNNKDCNDSNANINPGANEQCNEIDDNCNNQIDEDVKNACGKCGPVPTEICDGIDNDCD
ncbi:regulator of chromosome condensation, partial [Candidatus Magnetomorum sp. HK-1]